eukprot:3305037-Prymnesium_polylepis.3
MTAWPADGWERIVRSQIRNFSSRVGKLREGTLAVEALKDGASHRDGGTRARLVGVASGPDLRCTVCVRLTAALGGETIECGGKCKGVGTASGQWGEGDATKHERSW